MELFRLLQLQGGAEGSQGEHAEEVGGAGDVGDELQLGQGQDVAKHVNEQEPENDNRHACPQEPLPLRNVAQDRCQNHARHGQHQDRGNHAAEIHLLRQEIVDSEAQTWNDQAVIVLMNIDTMAASVDLSAYADWTLAATLSADGSDIVLNDATLELPAFGTAVLIPSV